MRSPKRSSMKSTTSSRRSAIGLRGLRGSGPGGSHAQSRQRCSFLCCVSASATRCRSPEALGRKPYQLVQCSITFDLRSSCPFLRQRHSSETRCGEAQSPYSMMSYFDSWSGWTTAKFQGPPSEGNSRPRLTVASLGKMLPENAIAKA
jgi:hypothetical protein